MGGKNKQSQRTKNNVRPSSSGRSAELLTAGAGNLKASLFPTLADTSSIHYLNNDFMLCIKKLSKKDPITKTKALQELTELIKTISPEEVTCILQHWVRLYPVLSTDADHKVREGTQVAHGGLVGVAGRSLAPHVRALAPAWLAAQYDTYPPAATAAQRALNSTFPENKLPELLSFCKGEVMTYIIDNLIGDAAAVSKKKGEEDEAGEGCRERVVLSSLCGAEHVVTHLADVHRAWLYSQLQQLLRHDLYWQYAQHASLHVRAAFFTSLGRVMERFPQEFSQASGARAARVLLVAAARHESHATVQASLWACLISLMQHAKDIPVWTEKRKELTNRILEFLENGGCGAGLVLLPLAASLPTPLVTAQFYTDFFIAILKGLDKKNVLTSKSERQAWLTNMVECMRYLSIQHIEEFAPELLTGTHRAWLEKTLSTSYDDTVRSNLIKHSAASMTMLLKYWLKASQEGKTDKYDQLIRNFWQNIGATMAHQLESELSNHDCIKKCVEGHVLLLNTLKSSLTQDNKKKLSIKFDGDPVDDGDRRQAPADVAHDPAVVERFMHNLTICVEMMSCQYFEFARTNDISSPVLTPLVSLLEEFDSKKLYMAIGNHLNSVNDGALYGLYEQVLKRWLCLDTMRCQAVVDITFFLLKHLTDTEQEALFNSFDQLPLVSLWWCVRASACAAARGGARGGARARTWLRGAGGGAVRQLCARGLAHRDTAAVGTLLVCFTHDATGEMIISKETVGAIWCQLSDALADLTSDHLEHTASVAARLLACGGDSAGLLGQYEALLMQLYTVSLSIPCGDSRLSRDTWWEVLTAWQDGLLAASSADRRALVRKAGHLAHQHLFQQNDCLNLKRIDHIVTITTNLINNFTETSSPEDCADDIVALIKDIFNFDQAQETVPVQVFSLRYDCMLSNLNCPFENENDLIKSALDPELSKQELTKSDLILYGQKCMYRGMFLRDVILGPNRNSVDEDAKIQPWCAALLSEQIVKTEFMKLLHDCAVLNTLSGGYAFWPHYNIIQDLKTRLNDIVDEIVKHTQEESSTKLYSDLSQKAITEGYYWCYARKVYEVKIGLERTQACEQSLQSAGLEEMLTGHGFFHCLQADTKNCLADNGEEVLRVNYLLMVRAFYLAFADQKEVTDEEFVQEVLAGREQCDLDPIVKVYYKHNHVMLYERELLSAPWSQVLSNTCVAHTLTSGVLARAWDLPQLVWDFTTISLCSLLTSLENTKQHWYHTKIVTLAHATLGLYRAVEVFIAGVKAACEQRQPSEHVAELPAEWGAIFAPDLHQNLFRIILHILGSASNTAVTANHVVYIDALIQCVPHMSWDLLPQHLKVGELTLESICRVCAKALETPSHHAFKYLSYAVMEMLSTSLVLEDAQKLSLWSSEESSAEGGEEGGAEGGREPRPAPRLCLHHCADSLMALQDLVDAILAPFTVCEQSCAVLPGSDSHSVVLGYLLLHLTLLSTTAQAKGDLMHHYIHTYKESASVGSLLSAVLRLLPAPLVEGATSALPALYCPHFTDTHVLRLTDVSEASDIARLACRCMYSCVAGAGMAAARGWWGASGARVAGRVRALVGRYVTPALLRQQLGAVQRHKHALADTQVEVHTSTREVVCTHVVDERPVSLTLSLSDTHPLTLPRVSAPGSPATAHWIPIYLSYQTGSVWGALRMWVETVDKRVERAPVCYICYCRLHPSTGRLPTLQCRQCKNKYHQDCLQKWFSTSKKSNCPLCRAEF